jgi:hypothetical protein
MDDKREKLPKDEVDDDHDSIDILNLEGWIKRENKRPSNEDEDKE